MQSRRTSGSVRCPRARRTVLVAATPNARARAPRPSGLPFDPLDHLPDDPSLWAEVPLELLVRFDCVPVRREAGRLVLAFGGLERPAGRRGRVPPGPARRGGRRAREARVAALLKRHRGGEMLLEQASEALRLQLVADDETEAVAAEPRPRESPIVRLVDSLILGAIDRRASDIHIETKDREVLAKYRIDGVLYPALDPLDKRTTTPSSAASRSCPSWTSRRSACPRTAASACA